MGQFGKHGGWPKVRKQIKMFAQSQKPLFWAHGARQIVVLRPPDSSKQYSIG